MTFSRERLRLMGQMVMSNLMSLKCLMQAFIFEGLRDALDEAVSSESNYLVLENPDHMSNFDLRRQSFWRKENPNDQSACLEIYGDDLF